MIPNGDCLGERIFQTLRAMGDEEQATCIHCGSIWYAVHFQDGVCHTCQQKGLPGRAAQQEIARRRAFRLILTIAAVSTVALLLLLR